MKNFTVKKLMVSLLAVVLCGASVLATGCSGRNNEENPLNKPKDETKTQLNIGVYDGGFGTTWTRKVADAFEEYYKDKSFEKDKMGVQVNIDPQKVRFEGATLVANIQANTDDNDMYLTSTTAKTFLDADVCADITSVLGAKVYDDNGEIGGTSMSILDKMDDYFVEAYRQADEKYYVFPFEDSIRGIVYDADLFEKKGYTVPATMDEFYTLLDRMVQDKITPFTWTGNNDFYYTSLTTNIVVQYEGVAGADQNLFYNGTFNGTEINNQNAYLLAGQQGKLEALKFLRKITSSSSYYSKMAFAGSQTHLIAQQEFLLSTVAAKSGSGRRIAMLLDGDWWENEARAQFTEMSGGDPESEYAYGKRKFRFMPMPKMTGQKTEGTIFTSSSNGCAGFVRKDRDAVTQQVAGLWIQFMHSNSSLATFTQETSSVLPYEYTLTTEQYNSLTPFGQDVWDIRRDKNVTIYHSAVAGDFYTNTPCKMGGVSQEIKHGNSNNALRYFYNNPKVTAETYFEESKTYYKTVWDQNKHLFN